MSCQWTSGLTDSCRKRKFPFERIAAASASAAVEVGSPVEIARAEAKNVVVDNAAAAAVT